MADIKTIQIETLLHDDEQGDRISFASLDELQRAQKEINQPHARSAAEAVADAAGGQRRQGREG